MASVTQKNSGFPLPEVIDNGARTCVQFEIPDQPEYRQAILGHVYRMARWWSWERDGGNRSNEAADLWKKAISDSISISNDGPCVDELTETCVDYPPYSSKITWWPFSPFETEGFDLLNWPAWFVIGATVSGWLSDLLTRLVEFLGLQDLVSELSGYQYGDVITTIANFERALGFGGDLSEVQAPGFRFDWTGPGTVELHLLEVLAGGYAFVSVDADPFSALTLDNVINLLQSFSDPTDLLMDLERKIGSTAVGEIGDAERIIEVSASEPGPHYVVVRFIPVLEADLTFIGFGGGLRKVTLCSPKQEGAPTDMFDLRVANDCSLEYSKDDGVTWQTVPGSENFGLCFVGPQGPPGPVGPEGPQGVPGVPGSDADSGEINDYPPTPDVGTSEYCNAVENIVDELESLILGMISDLGTITPTEVLEGLIGIGGWEGSWLNLAIQYVYVNMVHPDLATRCQALRQAVKEAFYCNSLSPEGAIQALQNDTSITDVPARETWVNVIRAAAAGNIALWAFVGSTKTGADCSGIECDDGSWAHTFDFDFGSQGWQAIYGSWNGSKFVAGDIHQSAWNGDYRIIYIETDIAVPTTINKVTYTYALDKGPYYQGGGGGLWFTVDGDIKQWIPQVSVDERTIADPGLVGGVIAPVENPGNLKIAMTSSLQTYNSDVFGGSPTLLKVRFEGVGTNPFV